jgi:hypothetical protein
LEGADWQVTSPYATCADAVTDLVPVAASKPQNPVNVPLSVPLAVPEVPLHVYVTPCTGEVTWNTTSIFIQTVPADTRVIAGLAGNGTTTAAAAAEVSDKQITPLDGTRAYTLADLVPVVAPLTVNVPRSSPLAAPELVPVTRIHAYVAPLPLPEAANLTFVP